MDFMDFLHLSWRNPLLVTPAGDRSRYMRVPEGQRQIQLAQKGNHNFAGLPGGRLQIFNR